MSAHIGSELAARLSAGAEVVLGNRAFFREHFGRVESLWKEDGSRVTQADLELTRRILGALSERFPSDELFSEEGDPKAGPTRLKAPFSWILDPVDGTNNYALGIPFCAISLALLHEGMPVGGWLYDFSRERLIRGGPLWGAFEDERPVRVQAGLPGPQSVIAINAPMDPTRIREIEGVLARHKIRCLGSSALHLAYAGTGLVHGALDHNVKVWDIAAGAAVLAGAGGEFRPLNAEVFPLRAFDLSGPRIPFVAGNPSTCDHLQALLGR